MSNTKTNLQDIYTFFFTTKVTANSLPLCYAFFDLLPSLLFNCLLYLNQIIGYVCAKLIKTMAKKEFYLKQDYYR